MKPGNESSEYSVVKWIVIICGILGTAMTTLVGSLIASGAIEQNSVAASIMSAVVAVLVAVGGGAGMSYTKGRSIVKASELAAKDPPEG